MSKLHQITVFESGKVLITRQYGKRIKHFQYQVKDPGHVAVKLYSLPYMQFAAGRGYTFFVRK